MPEKQSEEGAEEEEEKDTEEWRTGGVYADKQIVGWLRTFNGIATGEDMSRWECFKALTTFS